MIARSAKREGGREQVDSRRFERLFFGTAILGLLAVAVPTVVIDPFFHYHGPLPGLAYELKNERYQNDGILRYFSYDAVMIGTSMMANFKTTEMDGLFGVDSVKVSYFGGNYKEIGDALKVALKANPDIRMVLMTTDLSALIQDKDASYYGNAGDASYVYPTFMIDGDPFTDVYYILNKTILLEDTLGTVRYTRAGGETTSFDDYSFWEEGQVFGREAVLATYERPPRSELSFRMSEEDKELVRGNVRQNVADIARAYPSVDFYVFIPPYSICYWDVQHQNGIAERDIDGMEVEIEELVGIHNIRLFAFGDRQDIVCDLDNYKDQAHYSAAVNSELLRCMAAGEGRLTKDNYQDYIRRIRELYMGYDYDRIYVRPDIQGSSGL